jgi:hypothetical protein
MHAHIWRYTMGCFWSQRSRCMSDAEQVHFAIENRDLHQCAVRR